MSVVVPGFIIVLLCLALQTNCNPGDVNTTGFIVGIEREGIRCKTNEIYLKVGGLSGSSNGGNGSAAVYDSQITADNDSLLALAKEYMRHKVEVNMDFHTAGVYSLCHSNSGKFLTGLTPK